MLVLALLSPVADLVAGSAAAGAQPADPIVNVDGDIRIVGTLRHNPGMTVGDANAKSGGRTGRALRSFLIMRRVDGKPVMLTGATPETLLMADDTLSVSAYPAVPVARSAGTVVQYLTAGQFDFLPLLYEPAARRSFSARTLRTQWDALQRRYGPFQRQLDVHTETRESAEVGVVVCELAKGRAEISVTFNSDGRVLGISIVPVTP